MRDESDLAGAREGGLTELFGRAGLRADPEAALEVGVRHATFDKWWQTLALGVGPAGNHVARLDDAGRADLRERCRERLGDGPFTISGRAWAARAAV